MVGGLQKENEVARGGEAFGREINCTQVNRRLVSFNRRLNQDPNGA
jgi:hypothetical protein